MHKIILDKMEFSSVIPYKNKMIFFDNCSQSLMQWDKRKDTISILKCFRLEIPINVFRIMIIKNIIYMFDKSYVRIVKSCIDNIDELEVLGSQSKYEFADFFLLDSKVWMVPLYAGEKFGIFDLELEEIIQLDKEIPYKEANDELAYPTMNNYEIIMPALGKNYMYTYDIKGNCFSIIEIGREIQISSCKAVRNKMFLTQYENDAILLYEDGTLKFLNKGNKVYRPYSFLIEISKYLIALPGWGNNIAIYDKVHDKLSQISLLDCGEEIKCAVAGSKSLGCFYDDELYLLPLRMGKILKLNVENETLKPFESVLNDEDVCLYSYQTRGETLYLEDEDVGLKQFIHMNLMRSIK